MALTREAVASVPGRSRASGRAATFSLTVGSLLGNLDSWFVSRSTEERQLRAERNAHLRELSRLQGEVGSLNEASRRQAGAFKHAMADREPYRRERDALRATSSRLSRDSAATPARPRDPYEGLESIPLLAHGSSGSAAFPHGGACYGSVPMRTLGELDSGVPGHLSYFPSGAWGKDSSEPRGNVPR